MDKVFALGNDALNKFTIQAFVSKLLKSVMRKRLLSGTHVTRIKMSEYSTSDLIYINISRNGRYIFADAVFSCFHQRTRQLSTNYKQLQLQCINF